MRRGQYPVELKTRDLLEKVTHISSDLYNETEKLWPGTILFSPGKENTGGTAICFRDKNTTTNNIITEKNGNY